MDELTNLIMVIILQHIRISNHHVHLYLPNVIGQLYLNKAGNKRRKKAGVAILTSEKVYFRVKNITRDKEVHFTITKGSVKKIRVLNVNALSKT